MSDYGFYYYLVTEKSLHKSLALFAGPLQSLFSHFIIAWHSVKIHNGLSFPDMLLGKLLTL